VLHHVVIEVSDLNRSAAFYDAVISPLGWRRHGNGNGAIGYGISRPILLITERANVCTDGALVCLSAPGIAAVKAAWEAGCATGGRSVASPGETTGHGSGSYSAYLRDPDGQEIEITVASD
jgi:catechol 2,3-dioxygenase-like lactoylglutathione lyase family enzyme